MKRYERIDSRPLYDNAFSSDNVYGHALELLARRPTQPLAGALHLDIGCGFGRWAEPLMARLQLKYVGLDHAEDGVRSLSERGIEAHQISLTGEDESFAHLQAVVAGRPVASISFLDTLEHLADGDAVLRAIARLGAEHSAYVVVSTPNVAHGDIGYKLAFGLWEYTDAGLLDHTHLRLFDNRLFEAALRQAGLHEVAAYDVEKVESDQHFPAEHPALAKSTPLHSLLHELRAKMDCFEYTNQFVRLCVAGPMVDVQTYTSQREVPRPFLTIVMRTQGQRPHTLIEALTCLAGQTDDDFEILILGHKLTLDRQLTVERIIEDSPEWLRNRIQLVLVDKGNRTHPLNVGFELAHGHYIAMLDDDDLPMAHWVETFHKLSDLQPGQVLRAVTVRQDVISIRVRDKLAVRAQGPLDCVYQSAFDFFEHVRNNHTPNLSVAYPRSTFHHLNIRFDEELTTTEDWDFLLRTAAVVGVASSPEITSVYRWWLSKESSRSVHPAEEWQRNYNRILAKMDSRHFLFPCGVTARIRSLLDHIDELQHELEHKSAEFAARIRSLHDHIDELQRELSPIQTNTYGPLRAHREPRIWQRFLSWLQLVKFYIKCRSDISDIATSPFFNRHWYRFIYPDVAEAGMDPALHFLLHGGKEGRHPGPFFDTDFYLRSYSDVAASGQNPLLHYIRHGQAEERQIRHVPKFW